MVENFEVHSLDDIDFDATEYNEKDLENLAAEQEEEYSKALSQQTANATMQEVNDAYTYWFLIVMLILFVFFISLGVIAMVRSRNKRYIYQQAGY